MRFRHLPILAVIAAAALGLSASSAAAYGNRTDKTPCDEHGGGKWFDDEGDNGVLICSAVFSISHTEPKDLEGIGESPPDKARADDCAPGSIIKGTGNPAGDPDVWTPHWFYTTQIGAEAEVYWHIRHYHAILTLRDGGAVNITPQFRNSNIRPKDVRYYFYCNRVVRQHRTHESPCDRFGDGKSVIDEGSNGVVHCSAIWQAQNDIENRRVPEWARPDDCAPGSKIKGTGHAPDTPLRPGTGNPFNHPDLWGPHWFFTPAYGSHLGWEDREPLSHILTLRGGHAVNINRQFKNTASDEPTPNRLYFYCTQPPKT
jgi:hypothetical protein